MRHKQQGNAIQFMEKREAHTWTLELRQYTQDEKASLFVLLGISPFTNNLIP